MSIHTRPIPAPKTLDDVASSPGKTPSVVLPEPHRPPQPSGNRPSEGKPNVEPDRQREVRAEPARADRTPGPWYRREPWLAVMLVAFLPLVATVLAPEAAKYPLLGLTGLTLIVGSAMLIRQEVRRPHPDSGSSWT